MDCTKLPRGSPETLLKKASECLDIAATQHQMADQQLSISHDLEVSADKLDEVGHALVDSAIESKTRQRRIDALSAGS